MQRRGTLVLALSGLYACNGSPGDGGAFNDATGSSGTPASTRGSLTGGPGSSGASTGASASTGSDTVSADSTGRPIFDVGGDLDLCGCGGSYIWIANADDSTVSKTNTKPVQIANIIEFSQAA